MDWLRCGATARPSQSANVTMETSRWPPSSSPSSSSIASKATASLSPKQCSLLSHLGNAFGTSTSTTVASLSQWHSSFTFFLIPSLSHLSSAYVHAQSHKHAHSLSFFLSYTQVFPPPLSCMVLFATPCIFCNFHRNCPHGAAIVPSRHVHVLVLTFALQSTPFLLSCEVFLLS